MTSTKKASLEKIVENGIRFLSKIFPLKSYLYFPLLSAALIWGIKRVKKRKEEILSWKEWLDPGRIEIKPDEFVLNFFKNNPALNKIYKTEIKKRDLKTLREAFNRLYPILGLEDPFLSALFYKELERDEIKKIVREFEERVSRAEKDIETFEGKSRLLEGLKTLGDEMALLNLELISQDKVQKAVADIIKKRTKEGNE